ncbi:prepilin-type N-terminal cleavage/methylation domain-containing protein [Lentisphaerota bacterium WC36G]|nr:prepilin-type N-terminal cleavage/methylation domain-containing protein [Lentisphaerae bacterium WC36]
MKIKNSQIKSLFTLVEMIVVIAIAAVLLSLSAPALKRLFSVQGAKSAAISVQVTLERARSLAITNNKYVAVAFLQREVSTERGRELAYRAMRICEVTDNNELIKWLDNWTVLEEGNLIVAVRNTASLDFNLESGSSGVTAFKDAMANDGQNVNIFSSTTEVKSSYSSGFVPFSDLGETTSSPSLNLVVFTPNGRTASSLTFFIAKAAFAGDAIVNKNPPDSYGEFVFVNKFTGRTKYGEIE